MSLRTEELQLTPDMFGDGMENEPETGPGDLRILQLATGAGHLIASKSIVTTTLPGPEVYLG